MGVDALAGSYPSLSPYCYVGGNPVRLVDPGGDSFGWYVIEGQTNITHFDSSINSQANLDKHLSDKGVSGTYIGESFVQVDTESERTFSYNTDGTQTESVLLNEVSVFPFSIGRAFENFTGYNVSAELSIGPQLGFQIGSNELQGGGNLVLVNSSTSESIGGLAGGTVQVNIFGEATLNDGFGLGGEVSLSGTSLSNLHNFEYEVGAGGGPASFQAEGYIGPGADKHTWGAEFSERRLTKSLQIKALIGFKIDFKDVEKK